MSRWGLLLTLAFVSSALGQTPNQSEVRLRKDLEFLTSDACEGRGLTTKGIQLAAEHIAAEFRKAGLKPGGPDGTYFQTFKLVRGFSTEPRTAPVAELQLNGPLGQSILLKPGPDFQLHPRSASATVSGGLVFVGHGIDSKEPRYDDFAGVDVKGKLVVVLLRGPRAGSSFAPFLPPTSPQLDVVQKIANAQKRGVAGVVVVNPRPAPGQGDTLPSATFPSRFLADMLTLPVASLSRDVADRLLFSVLRRSLADVEKDIDITLKPQPAPLTGWTGTLKVNRVPSVLEVKNVVGYLDGAGALGKEAVVVGAHYDHMGLEGNRFGFGGTSPPGGIGGVGFPVREAAKANIYRGADDNASGTSAVIELGRRFGALPNRSGRRLIFIAFTGEESGLLGSSYYTRFPVFPLRDTAAMVNLDMVGRMLDSRVLGMGLGTGKGLESLVDRLAVKHEIKLQKALTGAGPTDHMSFCLAGVPGVAFFTGFHEYYHLPSDRLETLNIPGLRRVVDLTADVMGELAMNPTRPEFINNMSRFDRSRTLWSMSPNLGAELDFTHKGPGVRLRAVVSGSVAATGGLKVGDRIDSLNGTKMESAAAYLDTVRALRPGTKLEVRGDRDGKTLELTVQLASVPFRTALGIVLGEPDQKEGLPLAEVLADGLASRAGLQAGDRLLAFNNKPLKTVQDLLAATNSVKPGTKFETSYLRKDQKKSTTIVAE